METKKNIKSNTIIGITIIIIGGLFFLRNFDIISNDSIEVIVRWQAILLLVGVLFYFTSNNKAIGLILIIISILGLIPDIWPLIFIALGGYIIFRNQRKNLDNTTSNTISEDYNPNQTINDTSIFGGAKKSYQIDNFRGGNITAIFGGSEISFMNSTLSEGTNKLNVFFLFGGSKILIPNNWNVSIQVTPILGGFGDKRIFQQDQEIDNSKTLIISGVTMFGGGELKNYSNF